LSKKCPLSAHGDHEAVKSVRILRRAFDPDHVLLADCTR